MTDIDVGESRNTDTNNPDDLQPVIAHFYKKAPDVDVYYNEYIEGSPAITYDSLDEIDSPENRKVLRVDVTERYDRGFSTAKMLSVGMTRWRFAVLVIQTVAAAIIALVIGGVFVASKISPDVAGFRFGPLLQIAFTLMFWLIAYRGAYQILNVYRLRAITKSRPVTQKAKTDWNPNQ